jgi:parallel beta-helix repeat protein
MRAFAVLALAAALPAIFGAAPVLAGPPTTVACGQVITQSIKVANDLSNCPGDGLVVGANSIKIDLGHHVIDGDGVNAAGDDGIDNTGGFDNVKIARGTIQQFRQGLRLVGATGNELEHLTVIQTFRGIELQGASNGNKIAHDKVSTNFDGIHLVGSDANKVDHNDVLGNTASAIVLITGSDNNTYRHNKIYKNNTAGFEPFNSTGLRFEHNDVKQNRIGIELFNTDASFITNNKIRTSTLDGIHSFNGSTANLFKKNRADENGANGIDVVDAGNTIAKNHADKNTNLGIFAAPGNVDGGGNKAKKNGNPAQCVGVTCH